MASASEASQPSGIGTRAAREALDENAGVESLEGSLPPVRPEHETEPAKTPHLHVWSVEGLLFGEAIAITGNAKALLQLRAQIDRALKDETFHPFEEAVYRDVNGVPFEVAVKRARSKEEMQEPVPKPERTAERLPWTEKATKTVEEGAEREEAK